MKLEVCLRPIIFFFLLTILQQSSARILTISNKPDRHDFAASARWLVSQNIWGVLRFAVDKILKSSRTNHLTNKVIKIPEICTLSIDHEGAPFGNVVSFSDGLPDKGKGIPYFYLTSLDPTARNAFKDNRASLSLSESPIGTCKRDPMDPTCSKLTLTGKLLVLEEGSEEAEAAKTVLFTKHPEMMDWPQDHDFRVFKLEITNIFLINWYGGAKPITVDEYLHSKSIKVGSFL